MKRILLPISFVTLLAASMLPQIAHSEGLMPKKPSFGWRAVGPSTPPPMADVGSRTFTQPKPKTKLTPPFAAPLAAPLSMETLTLDLGLATSVPAGADDLIAETARGLDYDWAQCYLFVRNHIRFTPCLGFMRGPERTLLDREGSDGDQAFLLLALLRASGYTATVRYIEPPDINGNGGFAMPLAGTASGYDAAAWCGASTNGTVSNIVDSVWDAIGQSRLGMFFWNAGTPTQSEVRVEHFWVQMTLSNQTHDLDPSFKPRLVTPPRDLLTDMGYTRTNLLAQAGGTVTNDWYVRGLASTNLAAELRRLSANLTAKWRTVGTNAPVRDFIGGDEIVPQDLVADPDTFHGSLAGSDTNFLAQSDDYKNSFRASLTVTHVGFTNSMWFDEIAARHLWLCYTNATGYPYPKAVLRLDDTIVLATEPAGSSNQYDGAYLTSYHPAVGSDAPYYSLNRALTNVYAIPMGFGGDHRGGMRVRAENELGRVRAAGLAETNVLLRSRVLELVGQQWLAHCAILNELDSRIKGTHQHFFYDLGLSAQETAPFVDFKNSYNYSSADASKLDGFMLFSSALEHGVLDEVNGTNRPAVSTIRVIDLANASNMPIYRATSSNWAAVKLSLTNYTAQTLAWLTESIATNGHWVLLPKSGQIGLNQWSGYGYIDQGPVGGGAYGTAMTIGGGLNGGFSSLPGLTESGTGYSENEPDVLHNSAVTQYRSADPVDMQAGASLVTRTDLAMAGPAPLSWTRSYDSRAKGTAGALGRGWTHSYDASAIVRADPDALGGRSAPVACAPSVVASAVVADLLAAGESAKNLAAACLVAKWWTDQLVDGAVTVKTENEALSFTRAPDGTYVPSPGVTATLARGTNGQFALQERLGRTWTFATNGTLSSITDSSGNSTVLYYSNTTYLVAVSNSFGRKFTVNWMSNRVASVSDSAGRGVAYRYNPSGCLTGVTDAASYPWVMTYDTNATFLSEIDPAGITNILNSYNALGQVTNQIAANGSRWPFGFAVGIRAWERDPFTNRIVYAYSDEGRLVQRVDRDNTTNSLFYDGQGQVVSNVDAIGRVTISQYDTSNRLVRLTEAANTANARSTAFVYDNQHRLVTVTNALGRATRMTYDASHRLTSRLTPDGTMTTNVYDSHGLPTSIRVLDAAGQPLVSTSFGYDNRGFATTVSSTDAGTNQLAYDNAGNVTNIVDALGHATRFAYDPRGFSTNAVDALTGRTVRAYTSAGRLSTVVDPLLHTNTFLWSASGRPAGVRFPTGGQTTNEYDAADRLVAARDVRSNRVAFVLDAMGRATRRSTPNWQEQTWFDIAGCATARLDAVTGRTDIGYDTFNRPVTITDPMRRTWTNNFDALDTLTDTIDPKHRTTSYTLDNMDRRTGTAYPSGRPESFGLDGLGRMTAFTNSEGRVYRLAYDGQSRLVAATNAAAEQVFRNYFDPCGNLTNHLDGAARSTRRQFDILNRCTNTVYADDSAEGFNFDAAGNLLSARNASTTNSFAYDSMDRLTSSVSRVAGVAFTNKYRYDLGGLATNLVYPDGKTVRYDFDADGGVTNVVDWAQRSYRITRDPVGRVTALAYSNGISGAWQYDSSHAVSNWSYSGVSGLPGRSIVRDVMGLKIREDVNSGPMPVPATDRRVTNTFNTADRLTSAQVTIGTSTFTETYRYDSCGALTNIVRSAGTNDVYAYDLAGRMTAASASNLSLAAYYDALGNRVKTTVNGVTRLWVVDHTDPLKRPLMETTTNGTPVRYYVWGAGRLLAAIDADGTTRYAHCDDQGSVVAFTSTNGAVLFTATYGPYGELWGTTGTNVTPFGWLGGYGVFHAGSSSLYLTRHRAYDTTLKRFLSQDPLGLGGGPNIYAYARGNPLSYIDPFGLCTDYNPWTDSDVWISAGQGALQGAAAYGKGLAIGAAGAVVVVGGAAVAVTVGVPAAIVSGGLVILGGAGVVTTVGSIINNPSAENISYNIGGLTGAGIVGGASGRYLSSKLSPPNYQASPEPVTLSGETSMRWIDPNHPDSATAGAVNYLLNFSAANQTGPSTIGAASAAGGAGSGVAAGLQLLLR